MDNLFNISFIYKNNEMVEDYSNKLHLINTVVPLFFYGYIAATENFIFSKSIIYFLILIGVIFTAFQIYLIREIDVKIKRISRTRFTQEDERRYFKTINYLGYYEEFSPSVLDYYILMGNVGRIYSFLAWGYGLFTLYIMLIIPKDVVIWSSIIIYLIGFFYLAILVTAKIKYLIKIGTYYIRNR